MRPRSETLWPFCRAHARIAANNVDRTNTDRMRARYYARNNTWDPFGLFD